MSAQPLVSVIIIFLNEARFLSEAIESVLFQTYVRWELLLIDDGSTDGSSQMAQSYAARMPDKVRYLTHKNHQNLGMSASRNLGIAAAEGTYIAYLDGDDVWVPHKLADQVAIALSQPQAAMVYGPLLDWYSWADHESADGLYGVGKSGSHPYANSLVEPPKMLQLFLENEDFIPSGGLIQREAIAAVGGYEPAFRGGYSDAVAFVKLCLHKPVWVSSQCWYHYRQHPHSSTAISFLNGEDLAEARIYLTWVTQYLTEQGVAHPALWQALGNAMWPHRHPHLHRLRLRLKFAGQKAEAAFLVVGRKILPRFLRHWLWTSVKGQLEAGG